MCVNCTCVWRQLDERQKEELRSLNSSKQVKLERLCNKAKSAGSLRRTMLSALSWYLVKLSQEEECRWEEWWATSFCLGYCVDLNQWALCLIAAMYEIHEQSQHLCSTVIIPPFTTPIHANMQRRKDSIAQQLHSHLKHLNWHINVKKKIKFLEVFEKEYFVK